MIIALEDKYYTRGDDIIESFTVFKGNEPMDMTVFQDIVFEIRNTDDPTSALFKRLNLAEGVQIDAQESNRIILHIDSSTSFQMIRNKYAWTLRVVYPGGLKKTWRKGNINVINIPSDLNS